MLALEFTPTTTIQAEDYLDGYQSAPLLLVGDLADADVMKAQDTHLKNVTALASNELTKYTSGRVIDFSTHAIAARVHQREGLNASIYLRRPYKSPLYHLLPDLSKQEIDQACEKLPYAKGSMLENEIARVAMGMDSVEYANLTIIGERRKYLEGPMWDEVSEFVGHDATPNPDSVYRTSVLGFDRDIRDPSHSNFGAMRIGIKHLVGVSPYQATVKGRTTAIINMSSGTGIDRDLRELFRETAIQATQRNKETGELPDESEGRSAIANLVEFQRCVRWLMTTEVSEGIVLARNETVYGAQEAA